MGCCEVNGLNRVFSGPLVRQELRAFRRKGLNKRRAQIVGELENVVEGSSVLEIGCGVGAISTTLLRKGARVGHYVEISSDYLEAAQEVAKGAGVSEKATFHLADFASAKNRYASADIVVLDRVVCCYPDGIKLIAKAARHSERYLVYTYPRPLWFIRIFKAVLGFTMRLFRQDYRFFLHDPEKLSQAAAEAGHVLVATRAIGLWRLVVLSKGVDSSALTEGLSRVSQRNAHEPAGLPIQS
jgi:SAM-dependent methyltransferase